MLPVRILRWIVGQRDSRGCAVKVDELQQKVRVLQAVRYGAMEAEEGPDTHATASLEAALLAKARRLEHDLTMTRLKVAELTGLHCVPHLLHLPQCMFAEVCDLHACFPICGSFDHRHDVNCVQMSWRLPGRELMKQRQSCSASKPSSRA